MEAQSLISHQLSWWFICFSLCEKAGGLFVFHFVKNWLEAIIEKA